MIGASCSQRKDGFPCTGTWNHHGCHGNGILLEKLPKIGDIVAELGGAGLLHLTLQLCGYPILPH